MQYELHMIALVAVRALSVRYLLVLTMRSPVVAPSIASVAGEASRKMHPVVKMPVIKVS